MATVDVPTERDMMDMLLKRLDIKYETLRGIHADVTNVNWESQTYLWAMKEFTRAAEDIWKFKNVWYNLGEFWKE